MVVVPTGRLSKMLRSLKISGNNSAFDSEDLSISSLPGDLVIGEFSLLSHVSFLENVQIFYTADTSFPSTSDG